MRKPFFWKARGAWYLRLPGEGGKLKTVRLAEDRDTAFRVYEAEYRPILERLRPRRYAPPAPPAAEPEPLPLEATPPAAASDPAVESRRPARTPQRRREKPSPPAEQPIRRYRPDDDLRPIEPRLTQLARVLTTAAILSPLRFPVSIQALARDVANEMGQTHHPRTTLRDCEALALLGVLSIDRPPRSSGAITVRWCGGSVKAVTVERMAELFAQRAG